MYKCTFYISRDYINYVGNFKDTSLVIYKRIKYVHWMRFFYRTLKSPTLHRVENDGGQGLL